MTYDPTRCIEIGVWGSGANITLLHLVYKANMKFDRHRRLMKEPGFVGFTHHCFNENASPKIYHLFAEFDTSDNALMAKLTV